MRRKLLVLACVALTSACGAGSDVAEVGFTAESTTSTISDPYGLDDLADARTVLASTTTQLFTNDDYGGDIVAPEFTCDALSRAASYEFEICVIAGTPSSPFALVIGDQFVDRQPDVATTSLLYQVFQPVAEGSGVRAVKVLGGTTSSELVSFDSRELTVNTVDAGVAGKAVSLHFRVFGGSRTWNVIEMVGLNQFDAAAVVASFSGEGVAAFADARGFIFTNYHYADNEGLCCASYWAINYFRPGAYGWTHSVRTVPNDPDLEMTDSEPFRQFKSPDLVATYKFARALSNGE